MTLENPQGSIENTSSFMVDSLSLVFQIPPEKVFGWYVFGVQIPPHKVFGSLGYCHVSFPGGNFCHVSPPKSLRDKPALHGSPRIFMATLKYPSIPRCSMYGIFAYISPKFIVNDHVGKYSSPMGRLGYNWFFQTL